MTPDLQSIGRERQTGRKTAVRRVGERVGKSRVGERERLSGERRRERTDGQQELKGLNFWDGVSGPGPEPGPNLRIMVLQDLDLQALEDDQHAEM